MRKHTFATALPTRLAALAALGLLITACGNEPTEVNAPAPDQTAPDETAEVELVIERSLSEEDALTPEEGFEEGEWTLTCAPAGGDHPDPEAACAEIADVGTEPFTLDTSDSMCTMQIGGPEVVRVTGHVNGTDIDTEFNKRDGCEIERFEEVHTVLNP
ncbi:SSI family serine proteinase inhibitor [Nocardiopsis sp. SBT366]|uniref:SSI family serine proteinase inhibitor n=1 Tax=Nocardiopsis sp. SBT366 TaxID=1580529 RepID=UPI00066C8B5E|nr:SSI family serine proteinase inhibitor [Nocardiopsis sp. SBT366]